MSLWAQHDVPPRKKSDETTPARPRRPELARVLLEVFREPHEYRFSGIMRAVSRLPGHRLDDWEREATELEKEGRLLRSPWRSTEEGGS